MGGSTYEDDYHLTQRGSGAVSTIKGGSDQKIIHSIMTGVRETIAKELHAPARRNFPTRAVEVKGIHDLYQADLVEMIPHSKLNKGFKYILTMINCFTKYAFAVPLKDKSGPEIVRAITPIVESHPMNHLHTDQGKEFYNVGFSKLMNKHNINHYSVFSEKKGAIVERFNRSLKSLMWRKFTELGNYKWVDILPMLLEEYNTRKHRTIGMAPVEVNEGNEDQVRQNINKNRQKYKSVDRVVKFKVGDKVRISKYKKPFAKGYLPNWTNEIFTVHEVVKKTIPTTYKLKDYRDNVLEGSFYGKELLKAKLGDVYLVEKVMRKKGNKVLVRWLGFDGEHDSWIHKKDMV